jgi:NAD(P)-dependent dehydrogenase (short-subunit alcohol dehydrogenase family)
MRTAVAQLLLLFLVSSSEIISVSSMNAVVTGANRGLGLELVKQLCDKGDATSTIYALCRKTSEALSALASNSNEKVTIVEGIDVSNDDVTEKLQSVFPPTIPIDLLIHNAGAFGPPENFPDEASIYDSQTLESITMDRMRYAFELNTLGPLRVTQALLPNLKTAAAAASDTTTKVIIVSSLMGSITDNTSGGIYGYRTAKAGVNMVGMSLAQDLKKDHTNIAVGLVHPGFVLTGFGGTDGKDHPEERRRPGQQDVGPSAKGVLDAVDAVNMANTGAFLHGNYGEGVKPLNW